MWRKSERTPGKAAEAYLREVADSTSEALKQHPELGVKDSPLNSLFVKRYKEIASSNPSYITANDWPVRLANECEVALHQQEASSPALLLPPFSFAEHKLYSFRLRSHAGTKANVLGEAWSPDKGCCMGRSYIDHFK